jgi:hypothetical protein
VIAVRLVHRARFTQARCNCAITSTGLKWQHHDCNARQILDWLTSSNPQQSDTNAQHTQHPLAAILRTQLRVRSRQAREGLAGTQVQLCVQDGVRQQLRFHQLTCGSELLQLLVQVCILWGPSTAPVLSAQHALAQDLGTWHTRYAAFVGWCMQISILRFVQAYIDGSEPARDPALSQLKGWILQLAALPHEGNVAVTQEVRRCSGVALKWSKQYALFQTCSRMPRDSVSGSRPSVASHIAARQIM